MPLFDHLDQAETGTASAPVTEPNLFESAKAVLRTHFGARWPLKLPLLFALVFWPLVTFWQSIKLDRAMFVTEWIKLSTESVIIFLILDILRHRSLSASMRESSHRLLVVGYVVPARTIITGLHAFHQHVDQGDMTTASEYLQKSLEAWKALEFSLSDAAIQSLPSEELRTQLVRSRFKLKPARCDSILKTFRAMRNKSEFNPDEFNELTDRFENFVKAINGGEIKPLETTS